MKNLFGAATVCLLLTAFPVFGAEQLSDLHVQKGVQCPVCHGEDLKNPTEPGDKTCLSCHERAVLIEKTKDLNKAVNPHNPPHNGECILCHRMHEEEVNNCAECHKYEFKKNAGR